jgi:hypothetical protein
MHEKEKSVDKDALENLGRRSRRNEEILKGVVLIQAFGDLLLGAFGFSGYFPGGYPLFVIPMLVEYRADFSCDLLIFYAKRRHLSPHMAGRKEPRRYCSAGLAACN